MLEGVQILNQTTVYVGGNVIVLMVGLAIGIITLICLICGILDFPDSNGAIGIAVILGALSYFCIIQYFDISTHIEYKVIIDDKVNFNEFNQKYKIISQEGQILTITTKKVGE